MKNAKTVANKNAVIQTMPTAKLKAICAGVISTIGEARATLKDAYKTARTALVTGIPSGLGAHQAAWIECNRRVEYYVSAIFESGQSDASSERNIRTALLAGLKADGYEIPRRALDDSEKAEKARAIAANVKAKQRALTKIKAELKKKEAGRKWREGELQELAEAHYVEQRDETKDQKAQQKAVASKLEGTTGFNVIAFPKEVAEGKYSDGAMPRSLAAFAAFVQTFKEESAE